MSLEVQALICLYLMLAAILGSLIGLERERRDKSAGLRTHMLVAVGACLFTSLSAFAFPDGDPTRIASNIVTGIGFLGAGVIYKGEGRMRELTTAASIWVTAAMGMAVGSGEWFLAIFVTLMVWVILAILRRLEEDHNL